MKQVRLTCPFTGVTFNAMLNECNEELTFVNPISEDKITCKYLPQTMSWLIPRQYFEDMEDLVSQTETAYILNITRQRVSQIAKTQVIKPLCINDKIFFRKSDVLEYKETRKVGAPRKEV